MVTVVLEIEYDVESEVEARARAERDAGPIFQQPDVLAVTADLASAYRASVISSSGRPPLPITERYLEDPE